MKSIDKEALYKIILAEVTPDRIKLFDELRAVLESTGSDVLVEKGTDTPKSSQNGRSRLSTGYTQAPRRESGFPGSYSLDPQLVRNIKWICNYKRRMGTNRPTQRDIALAFSCQHTLISRIHRCDRIPSQKPDPAVLAALRIKDERLI